MSAPRAVLLDVGFTLLRVRRGAAHHYAETGRRIAGFEAPPEDYRRAFGRVMEREGHSLFAAVPAVDDRVEHDRWRRFTRLLYREMGLEEGLDDLWRRLERIYTDPTSWEPYEDTRPVLDELVRRGVPRVVVSNWSTHLRGILEHHDLLARFDAMIGSCEVGVEKPDPGIFRLALDAIDVPPEAAIHVGDHPVADVLGARAAGVRPLLLDRDGKHAGHPERIGGLREVIALL